MYTLKVIAHSKSGKSILASVSRKIGILVSTIATGNIIIDGDLPAVGTVMPLEGITKVSVSSSEATNETTGEVASFNWLVLE